MRAAVAVTIAKGLVWYAVAVPVLLGAISILGVSIVTADALAVAYSIGAGAFGLVALLRGRFLFDEALRAEGRLIVAAELAETKRG